MVLATPRSDNDKSEKILLVNGTIAEGHVGNGKELPHTADGKEAMLLATSVPNFDKTECAMAPKDKLVMEPHGEKGKNGASPTISK